MPGVVESLRIVTRPAAERIVRFAFELARRQGRRRVTFCHKADVLPLSDGLFLECARAVADDYPFIEFEERRIDNLCMELVLDPSQFDVLVMENLFGDVISDLCAGLVGGLGLVPGANIGAATRCSRRSTAAPRTSPARGWPTRSPCMRSAAHDAGAHRPARRRPSGSSGRSPHAGTRRRPDPRPRRRRHDANDHRARSSRILSGLTADDQPVVFIQGGGIGFDQEPAVRRILAAAGVEIDWESTSPGRRPSSQGMPAACRRPCSTPCARPAWP